MQAILLPYRAIASRVIEFIFVCKQFVAYPLPHPLSFPLPDFSLQLSSPLLHVHSILCPRRLDMWRTGYCNLRQLINQQTCSRTVTIAQSGFLSILKSSNYLVNSPANFTDCALQIFLVTATTITTTDYCCRYCFTRIPPTVDTFINGYTTVNTISMAKTYYEV